MWAFSPVGWVFAGLRGSFKEAKGRYSVIACSLLDILKSLTYIIKVVQIYSYCRKVTYLPLSYIPKKLCRHRNVQAPPKGSLKGEHKHPFCGQKSLILVSFLKMHDFIMVNEGLTDRFWSIFWISMKSK